MSDAPTLYDQDDATIEAVLNRERMDGMQAHIHDLEAQVAKQKAALDECERALSRWASQQLPEEIEPDWRDNADFEAGYEIIVYEARDLLAKLYGDAQ